MDADPYVSVVVPTFNRLESLRRLIAGMLAQSYSRSAFEVVVVDDGSSDGTREFLRALAPPFALRIVEQPNAGPSAARNRGVAAAAGDIVVFLDDDVVPDSGLLAAHVESHAPHDPVAVVGPMNPPHDRNRPAWIRWTEASLQKQYRSLNSGEYPCTPQQFYTANASISRAQFLAVGGFDTSFKRNEDVELAYRLQASGVGFVFNPAAGVVHYPQHGFATWRNATYMYGRYDVVMEREKALATLRNTTVWFHQRNVLARYLVRGAAGRPLLFRSIALALRGVIMITNRSPLAMPAVSALSNLLYWQGVSDELGGRVALQGRLRDGERLARLERQVTASQRA